MGVVALITGILSGVFGMGNVFGNTALALVVSLVEWVVGSAVIAFIAKSVFQGSNGLGEILRVYGYVHLFGILGILPLLWIVGSILSAIGTIIGIREAADLDTGKAILAGIVASLLIYVLSFALNAALRGLI